MFEHFAITATIICLALLLDRCLGEPKIWHPLILFGRWADFCKEICQARYQILHETSVQKTKAQGTFSQENMDEEANALGRMDEEVSTAEANALKNTVSENQLASSFSSDEVALDQRLMGIVAWFMAVSPWVIIVSALAFVLPSALTHLVATVVLYLCVGWQSLREHAVAIIKPLQKGETESAREAVGYIVSRDTDQLDENDIVKAGAESVLENGSDAIFAPIFWFLLLGVPGVLFYRLVNTLDAMWGYKNEEFLYFGWCAAKVDDVLNYIPSKLVVLSYAACGNFARAIESAKEPSARWKSPNAGPVIAAGAGALDIVLGGKATYFGKDEERPFLGKRASKEEEQGIALLTVGDLKRAIALVDRSVYLWLVILCVFAVSTS